MVDIVFILIILRPKYCQENIENSISKHLNFKIFWGGACPQTPQTPLGSSHLRRLRSRLPPTFPVGTSTSKLIDSTVYYQLVKKYNHVHAPYVCKIFLINNFPPVNLFLKMFSYKYDLLYLQISVV